MHKDYSFYHALLGCNLKSTLYKAGRQVCQKFNFTLSTCYFSYIPRMPDTSAKVATTSPISCSTATG